MTDVRARITAVCITAAVQPRTSSTSTLSGINKGPVEVITVTATGVVADKVLDTQHHGGVDKAVYAYADEDAAWWAAQLEEAITPGRFGENLRTTGMDLTGAVIGERWQVGSDVVLEVSEPRTPCATFGHQMGDRPGWVRRFTQAGRVGTYLRVLTGGEIRPGDPVTLLHRPTHMVTVGGWFSAPTAADAQALLAAQSDDWQMPVELRWRVDRTLGTADV